MQEVSMLGLPCHPPLLQHLHHLYHPATTAVIRHPKSEKRPLQLPEKVGCIVTCLGMHIIVAAMLQRYCPWYALAGLIIMGDQNQ